MATKLRTREDIANWMVSIYQDALAFKYTHDILMKKFDHVYESRDWKRLTQRDREYVRGYARCYDVMVIQRSYTESGSWVTMPDGSVAYFGVRERLDHNMEQLNSLYPQLAKYSIHRYIHEHEIPERAGIYWVDGEDWNGKYPFFIPAIHSTSA
jgi:hypothetical protein